jgi:para-nitrobenzyl esterase
MDGGGRFSLLSALVNRRTLLIQGPMAVAGAAALRGLAAAQEGETGFAEVETTGGRVRGTRARGLATFKGVPYAGPVSGANRFKAAPPLRPWTGVRDALRLAAPAPQPGRPASAREPSPAEDCLFLNVWTPAADRRRRPVMFYSHGGGFTTGSGGSAYQDGGSLARTWDVVVVASNHRLGLMGYLSLRELGGEEYAASGNQGLLDIRDALRWVHDNIEAFGGDPGNVMIFGESGGGAKTSCLYAMPSAAPYFTKASIESGPGIRMLPAEAAAETTLMLLKHLALDRRSWRTLLELPLDTLVAAQVALGQQPGAGPLNPRGGRRGMSGNPRPGGFGPIVDGTVLPRHPFDPDAPAISRDKPLIAGYNRDETTFFLQRDPAAFSLTEEALKARLAKELGDRADTVYATYRRTRPDASPTDLYIAIGSAGMFGAGSVAIAERKAAQGGAPVFAYVFTHGSERIIPGTTHRLGAAHAFEIRFKFNLVEPDGASSASDPLASSGPAAVRTARNMSEMWSTFARTGRPAAQGQPAWPAYTAARRATMEIDSRCRVVDDTHAAERRMWERLDA